MPLDWQPFWVLPMVQLVRRRRSCYGKPVWNDVQDSGEAAYMSSPFLDSFRLRCPISPPWSNHDWNSSQIYMLISMQTFNMLYLLHKCSNDFIIGFERLRWNYLFTSWCGHCVQNGMCDDHGTVDHIIMYQRTDKHLNCSKTEWQPTATIEKSPQLKLLK